MSKFNGAMADHHLALHAHHAALSDHYDGSDEKLSSLHHGIAGHHLKMAEQYAAQGESSAQGAPPAALVTPLAAKAPAEIAKGEMPGKTSAAKPGLLLGAAKQLNNAGHLSDAHHDRIRKAVTAKPKAKAFGSLAGAGHYMGNVDDTNSAGTNAGSM